MVSVPAYGGNSHATSVPSVALVASPSVEANELAKRISREVVQLEVVPLTALKAPPPSHIRVALYLVDNPSEANHDQFVSWIRSAEQPVALLGYAPEGQIADSVQAFEAGVDDFVIGPRHPRELACRINALKRRLRSKKNPVQPRWGDVVLDKTTLEVWLGHRQIALTRHEASLLRALVGAQGRPLSRSQLLDAVWGESNLQVTERAVDSVVLRIRRKLGGNEVIQTVRGVGFRLASSD